MNWRVLYIGVPFRVTLYKGAVLYWGPKVSVPQNLETYPIGVWKLRARPWDPGLGMLQVLLRFLGFFGGSCTPHEETWR